MKLGAAVIDELRVDPGTAAGLSHRSTLATSADWLGTTGPKEKLVAEDDLRGFVDELRACQELLWSSDRYALLVVLQAMDAAGKDGTIKHVMSGVNPQGCEVTAFGPPSPREQAHDFLWRCVRALPARGHIGIFNRSYYEDVLVVRVHPERLPHGRGGPDLAGHGRMWRDRFEDINAFEHHLHRSGTRMVKIFLHVSKEEQKRRFLQRIDDPRKFWKLSAADLTERGHWDEYQAAYEEALTATSTRWAPWYVVPADHKYALRALVGGVMVHAVDTLDLRPPPLGPDDVAARQRARDALLAE
jgi:PPK2 family polyphosphate:nucleotide phosphotransferase